MKRIFCLFIIVILIFSFCSCTNSNHSNKDSYTNNSSTVDQDNDSSNNTFIEEKSFKDFILSELEKKGYNVERNSYGYDVSLLDVHAIYANDLYFYGPGSLVADNIDGCSLDGDKNAFSKDNQYKVCCNALFEILNIDDTIDNVLSTFDEQTKRSDFFSNERYVWYLRFRESTSNFNLYIFDLLSVPTCIQSYDLTKWTELNVKMFEQPTVYSGSKVKFTGKLTSITDVNDEDYTLKKELTFQLNAGETVAVTYDYGYFPYNFTLNSSYEIYGTLSDGKILFKFFKDAK